MKESTRLQLAGYGALAAAGLTCSEAQAAIVTSNSIGFIPFTIGAGEFQFVDFGGSIGAPFLFVGSTFNYAPPAASFVLQTGGSGSFQSVIGLPFFGPPLRLPAGYLISSGRPWTSVTSSAYGNLYNLIAGPQGGFWASYFNTDIPPGTTARGFIGIRFQSTELSPGFHYGFFDVSYDNNPDFETGRLTVHGWAYETDADTPITTFDVAAPEPAAGVLMGLGMLACGAAGLRTLRAQSKN